MYGQTKKKRRKEKNLRKIFTGATVAFQGKFRQHLNRWFSVLPLSFLSPIPAILPVDRQELFRNLYLYVLLWDTNSMKREIDRIRANWFRRKEFELRNATMRFQIRLISTYYWYQIAAGRTVRLSCTFRKIHVTGILMFHARSQCCTNCGNYRKTKYLGHTILDLTEHDADAFRESSVDENWWGSEKNGVAKRIDYLQACCLPQNTQNQRKNSQFFKFSVFFYIISLFYLYII